MRSMSGGFLYSLFHFLVGVDAVGGDFDFGNTTEGEQELYEVLGWLFRSLFHNVGNSVGDRGLEHHTLGLQAGKVHTHELAGLGHDSSMKILPPRVVKCKPVAISRARVAANRSPKMSRGCRSLLAGCTHGSPDPVPDMVWASRTCLLPPRLKS